MKPGKDEFMTMSTRIKNFTNEILGATHIQYSIHIEPIVDEMVKDITTRKNIVLLIKEATNNAAKYSQANHLEISLSITNNTIYIKITDDGIGFNANEIKGNGVHNMKKRVQELGGNFSINTQPQKGTSIMATIPLSLN
jgi:signal transduction histidine kinase